MIQRILNSMILFKFLSRSDSYHVVTVSHTVSSPPPFFLWVSDSHLVVTVSRTILSLPPYFCAYLTPCDHDHQHLTITLSPQRNLTFPHFPYWSDLHHVIELPRITLTHFHTPFLLRFLESQTRPNPLPTSPPPASHVFLSF